MNTVAIVIPAFQQFLNKISHSFLVESGIILPKTGIMIGGHQYYARALRWENGEDLPLRSGKSIFRENRNIVFT
jgi:hypothetical protein